ncbi:MAG TPA: response regulator [Planctomycetota bacterium]|nr:response regulator [Planctomycetota bacterium]
MNVLLAEDSPHQRAVLEVLLESWGYGVVAVADGEEAWAALQEPNAPSLLLLDSVMPGIDGPELCRRLAPHRALRPLHVILLTSLAAAQDIEQGLEAGADDYVKKPFEERELRARLSAGRRSVLLQRELEARVRQLEEAASRIRQLEGILPICSYCRKIREDDQQRWQPIETYVSRRSKARFSHGICPDCYEQHVEPELRALKEETPGEP